MKRQPVTSSNIKSIGYDGVSETLEIEFNNGGIYEYAGNSEAVYSALMKAESHGSYFHRHIREKYRHRKIG